jgi:hypothetical protein
MGRSIITELGVRAAKASCDGSDGCCSIDSCVKETDSRVIRELFRASTFL